MARLYDAPTQSGTYVAIAGNVSLTRVTMPENGWITGAQFFTRAVSGHTLRGRWCVYVGNSRVYADPTVSTWNAASGNSATTYSMTRNFTSGHPRVAAGTYVRHGVYTETNSSSGVGGHGYEYSTNKPGLRAERYSGGFSALGTLGTPAATVDNEAHRGYIDYQPNVAPSAPSLLSPAAGATGVSVNPTFSFTIPHGGGDGAYDYTEQIELTITLVGAGTIGPFYYTPTTAQRNAGQIDNLGISLSLNPGTVYQWSVRHKDSWGVWSSPSATRQFTTVQGPNIPFPISPSGKINAVTGIEFSAQYTHPTPLNATQAWWELLNASGTTILATHDDTGLSLSSGSTRTVTPPWNLSWGTNYTWRVYFLDSNGVWSEANSPKSFRTDAAPNAPTNLSPADNQASQATLLSCSLSDPDGDVVQSAECEIVDATTNAVVVAAGAMTVDTATATATYDASSDLTLGTSYKWRARADDGLGPGYGAWSNYAFFSYVAGPTVALLAPQTRTNVIAQPSAEYDPQAVGAYWTEHGRGENGGMEINRVGDLNAAHGDWSWEGTEPGTANYNNLESPWMDLNTAIPWVLQAEFKKISEDPSGTYFRLACYDVNEQHIGLVYPYHFGDVAGTDVERHWTRYGGIVFPEGSGIYPEFPANTHWVAVEAYPSYDTPATVRFDGISFEPLSYTISDTDFHTIKQWYGYADGDSGAISAKEGGYSWAGAIGNSSSSVLPVLTEIPENVLIYYESPSSVAKHSDRMYIDRWDPVGGRWISVLTTGWRTSSSTLIPVPSTVNFRNGSRYRIKVECRDTNLVIGTSSYSEFDVRMLGAPEPVLTSWNDDPSTATITFTLAPTTLSEEEFGGFELLRVDPVTGERATISRVTNMGSVQVVDHFPASTTNYTYYLAQIKRVGVQEVAGRYLRVLASVNYEPWSFIKDAERPWVLAAFETRVEDLGAPEEDAPGLSDLAWGSLTRSHVFSRARLRGGTVVAEFFPEGQMFGLPSEESRYRAAREIIARRGPVALMLQRPDQEVLFVAIVGPATKAAPSVIHKAVSFTYEETSYALDFYEREGWQ